MPTAGELIDAAEKVLKASDAVEHPHAGKERTDAEEILAFVLGTDELDAEEAVSASQTRRFGQLIARRETGEPPAYIIGSIEFYGLQLKITPGAFIPRQSSEWTVDQALRRLRRRPKPIHVDIATGVGPVPLAVATRLSDAEVFGTDIAARALRLARSNAKQLGLSNVSFLQGDLFDPLPKGIRGRIDVISVHPPYVGKRELQTLPDEILKFEPEESLTDYSPLGDRILGRVARESPGWLRPGGWLLVEVSPDRAREVKVHLHRAGFSDVRSTMGGVNVSRVIVGRR
jgi:release factor glutamine methyltransferase